LARGGLRDSTSRMRLPNRGRAFSFGSNPFPDSNDSPERIGTGFSFYEGGSLGHLFRLGDPSMGTSQRRASHPRGKATGGAQDRESVCGHPLVHRSTSQSPPTNAIGSPSGSLAREVVVAAIGPPTAAGQLLGL